MARAGRLAPYGATGRFFGVVVSAVGSINCAVSVAGDATGGATGTVAAAVAVSGVGAPIVAGTGSILCRAITDGGIGASVFAGTGTVLAVIAVGGSSVTFRSRLGLYGASQHFYATPNKTSTSNKLWGVNETLGLSLDIADTDIRYFNLVDTFGISLASTAFFGSSRGIISISVTVNGASIANVAGVGAIAATVTPAGFGANVVTASGDGAIASLVDVAGQGATVGTVFGAGIGSVQALVAVAGNAISTYQAGASIASTAAVAGIGAPIYSAVGSISSTVSVAANSTDYGIGAGSSAAVVSVAGVGAPIKEALGTILATVDVLGIAQPAATLSQSAGIQIEVAAPTMLIEMTSSTIRIEIAA